MPRTRLAATWLPVVAWAAVIFALSSIPSLGTGLGVWDLVLRKLAHLTEFAILGALLARAVPDLPAFGLGVAYAVADEIHQHFVPGREGAPLDVAIDALGVAVGIAALRYVGAKRESDRLQLAPSAVERAERRTGGTAPDDP